MSDQACMQAALAKFMGTEECIMYSYDMATINSVLPAFANAKDVIICDEVCRPSAVCSSWSAAFSLHPMQGLHMSMHLSIHECKQPQSVNSTCSWLLHSFIALPIHRRCAFQP